MRGKMIKSVDLKNNLKLKFFDISRKLAGDRWYVGITARIDIPLTDSLLNEKLLSPYSVEEVRNALGETIRFEQKRDRHYIDEQKKDELLNDVMDSFLKSSVSYLLHPDFAAKYVLKEYKTCLKRQTWYNEEIHENL
jgi:hypothetical protein